LDRDHPRKKTTDAPAHGGEAKYANYLQGGMNETEFVLDFGQHYEGDESPRLHTRIVAAPPYVKAFAALLQNCIAEYEMRYGPIREIGEDRNPRTS
jgi:hypothetical protein